MAFSLADLDAILAYNPADHTIGPPPGVRGPGIAAPRATAPIGSDVGPTPLQVPTAQPAAIPSVRMAAANPNAVESLVSPAQQRGGVGQKLFRADQPTVTPGSPDYAEQVAARREYQELHPWGSTVSEKPGTWGKIAHGLSVAGDVLAPGLMQRIPGTPAFGRAEEARETALEKERAGTELEKAQAAGWAPMQITLPNGQTTWVPMRSAGAIEAGLAKTGETEAGKGQRQAVGEEGKTERLKFGEEQKGERQQTGIAARETEQGAALAAKPPKTVVMQDESGKNYEYEYNTQTKGWDKLRPAPPTAVSMGLIGSVQPLFNNTGEVTGTINTKTGAIAGLSPQQQAGLAAAGGGATTGQGLRTETTRANQFNTQYVNPANQAEQQYQRATEAVKNYNSNPKTGAADMVIFAQHLGTTLGGIKGAAIGEGAQQLHMNAIGLEDRLNRLIGHMTRGEMLTPNQVKDFYSLIANTRQLQWATVAREGARRGMPIDFIPRDVQIKMRAPDGSERPVPGDRVQEFVGKGASIEY